MDTIETARADHEAATELLLRRQPSPASERQICRSYFVTLADDQNVKTTDHWDGVDFTVNARPKNGLTLGGGVSVGRETVDECDLMNKPPENTLRFLPGPSGGDHVAPRPASSRSSRRHLIWKDVALTPGSLSHQGVRARGNQLRVCTEVMRT